MILPQSTVPPSDCTPLWWIPKHKRLVEKSAALASPPSTSCGSPKMLTIHIIIIVVFIIIIISSSSNTPITPIDIYLSLYIYIYIYISIHIIVISSMIDWFLMFVLVLRRCWEPGDAQPPPQHRHRYKYVIEREHVVSDFLRFDVNAMSLMQMSNLP